MENYILGTGAGNSFDKVAEKAVSLSIEKGVTVEFEFNGITCLANKDTNPEWLYRDYANAHTMDWKEVGPFCTEQYEPKIQFELDKRNEAHRVEGDRQRKEHEMSVKNEREAFNLLTSGVDIELIDVDKYNDWKSKNTDSYGACIFEYAEGWAKLMQVEISKGASVSECAEATSFKLGFLGITGYMYGAAVSILSSCWKHGEDLRVWHNKEYNHSGDGVVNPAILTISA